MYIIFDIGGTNTRVASSIDGKTISEPIVYRSPEAFTDGLTQLAAAIAKLAQGGLVRSIAGGLPGILDKNTGTLLHAPHLQKWEGKNLSQELYRVFSYPVYLENDAALGGLGEAVYGAGKDKNIIAYMTVSTGVGGVRIVQKQIDSTSQGFEPGHQLIGPHKILENVLSGTALKEKIGMDPANIKDPYIWKEVAEALAQGLHNMVVFWSPDVIILNGPLIVGNSFISLQALRAILEKTLPPDMIPPIEVSKLKGAAGLYGALVYASSFSK